MRRLAASIALLTLVSVSGGESGELIVPELGPEVELASWDADDPETEGIMAEGLSPDGEILAYLVTYKGDTYLMMKRLWKRGRAVRVGRLRGRYVTSRRLQQGFSCDGRYAFFYEVRVGPNNNDVWTLGLVDLRKMERVRVLVKSALRVTALFHRSRPEAYLLWKPNENEKARLQRYDLKTGGTETLVEKTDADVLLLSPNGNRLALVGEGGTKACLYRLHPFKKECELDLPEPPDGDGDNVTFMPEGARLLAGKEGSMVVVDASGATEPAEIKRLVETQNLRGNLVRMQQAPCGMILLTFRRWCVSDRTFLWHPRRRMFVPIGKMFDEHRVMQVSRGWAVAFDEPGARLLLRRVKRWRTATEDEVRRFQDLLKEKKPEKKP